MGNTLGADDESFERACAAIERADAMIIGAGAGMGVDSGLPDFRGPEGFWRAYPAYRSLGLSFEDLANPHWFARDPARAWGFYGHRLALYRNTVPHEGFALLRRFAARMAHGAFVFTSNVDGQFQRAGFDDASMYECHGAIDYLQCTRPCSDTIVRADAIAIDIDPETFRARGELPRCPGCGALARPNILMFGDGAWISDRTDAQQTRLDAWLDACDGADIVVIECGAGTAVPSVRRYSEWIAEAKGATIVRINVREPQVPRGPHVGIAAGARDALTRIASRLDH